MKVLYRFLLIMSLVFALGACNNDSDILPQMKPEATGSTTDVRDGYIYHWVRFGGLDWTVENSHFQTTEGTYAIYETTGLVGDEENANNERTFAKYGYLYTYEGALEAAPDGWRIPTDEDWKKLETVLGMSVDECAALEWRSSNVVGTLMHQGDEGTGLDMLYGGYYTATTSSFTSAYRLMYSYGFYWTSTKDTDKGDGFAYYRKIFYKNGGVFRYSCSTANMMSVRFVRDAN